MRSRRPADARIDGPISAHEGPLSDHRSSWGQGRGQRRAGGWSLWRRCVAEAAGAQPCPRWWFEWGDVKWLASLICVAGVALVLAAPAQARPAFGVVSQAPLAEADFANMESGGVETLRFLIRWRQVEPEPGVYDLLERRRRRCRRPGPRDSPSADGLRLAGVDRRAREPPAARRRRARLARLGCGSSCTALARFARYPARSARLADLERAQLRRLLG